MEEIQMVNKISECAVPKTAEKQDIVLVDSLDSVSADLWQAVCDLEKKLEMVLQPVSGNDECAPDPVLVPLARRIHANVIGIDASTRKIRDIASRLEV
jgi:hypothetical protein